MHFSVDIQLIYVTLYVNRLGSYPFDFNAKEPLDNERSWRAPDLDLCLLNILNADRA